MQNQLQAAHTALDKLVERIQVLRERGEARPLDTVQAKFALDLIRAIGTRQAAKRSNTKPKRAAKRAGR